MKHKSACYLECSTIGSRHLILLSVLIYVHRVITVLVGVNYFQIQITHDEDYSSSSRIDSSSFQWCIVSDVT